MFKFAKYFFIVFLITAILPLILMFAWNNSQMEHFHSIMMKNGLNNVYNKMEHTIKNNLKAQEGDVLKKMYFMDRDNYGIEKIKSILKDYNVEITKNTDEESNSPYSYYEMKNNNLYMVTILPYKGSGSLKISQKVDFPQLHPSGPFKVKVYSANTEIYEYNSPEYINFLKKKDSDIFLRLADKFFKLAPSGSFSKIIEIKNNKNTVIAKVILSVEARPFKGKIDNILTGLIILIVGIISSFVIGLIIKRFFIVPIILTNLLS